MYCIFQEITHRDVIRLHAVCLQLPNVKYDSWTLKRKESHPVNVAIRPTKLELNKLVIFL